VRWRAILTAVLLGLATLATPGPAGAAADFEEGPVEVTQPYQAPAQEAREVPPGGRAAQADRDGGPAPGGQGAGRPVAGIRPVSPEEFTEKIEQLGGMAYQAASPLMDMIAKLALALVGVLFVFFLVYGVKVVARGVGAVLAVAVGLGLWYGAPYIVGLVKWVVAWLQS